MARTSAHMIKAHGRGPQRISIPKEGTVIRAAYERAITGDWFILRDLCDTYRRALRKQLEDFDLELTHRPDPSGHNRRQYKCIGIWHGDTLQTLEDVRVALENTVRSKQ